MKKMNKKAFTLIELIVVIAVVGILVLLAAPRFIGQTNTAQDRNIQNDVKVAEMKVSEALIDGLDMWDSWTDDGVTSGTLKTLIGKDGTGTTLYSRGGPIYDENEVEDGGYRVLPETFIEQEIRSRLEGAFYANQNGTVYYESGVARQGEADKENGQEQGQADKEEPGYSDEKIQDLIAEGYIPIATAEELNNVRDTITQTYGEGTKWKKEYEGGLGKKYVQVADIDLSIYSKEGWNPIGTDSSRFTGIYDGGNYVIRNLYVNGDGKDEQGLFGFISLATIRNVGLEDIEVTGAEYVGGLVGRASQKATIENSYAKGSVTGNQRVGGLVGSSISYLTTISNSYFTGSVTGKSIWVGGLVGTINNSATISNSYATGSVTGYEYVGGFVGYAGDSTKISNSYATGSVTGLVEGSSNVGGFVGAASLNIKVSSSYWDKENTGQSRSARGIGKSTDEMMKQTTYSGWGFDEIWEVQEGVSYPTLINNPERH